MVKRPLCTAAVLFLCIQAVLTGWFGMANDQKSTCLEQALQKEETVSLEGTVYRREEKPEYNILYLKDNSVLLNKQFYQESNILVYVKTKDHISIGNKARLSGTINTFQSARNPGNFDQKFYYQKQGIHLFVWADKVTVIDAKVRKIEEWLAVLRTKWKAVLIDALGEYYGNCMSAILLGDKSELDSNLKDLYQKSGIGHILAISGLHMSFLGSGLYKLLRKAGVPFLIAGSLGIFFLTGYTLMIGYGVSSLRALTMFIVRMGADITGRDYDVPTSLALAGAIITARQPLYILDAGFLLSFGAIAGIVVVAPGIRLCFREKKNKQKLLDNFCASLGVNLALLPIMLYFYFEFPPYSIFLNLLIIPLMGLVLSAGVLGSLLCLFWVGAGKGVLLASKGVLVLYENACRASMALPGSRMVTGQPGVRGIMAYYVLLLIFFMCIHVYKDRIKRIKPVFCGSFFGGALCLLLLACPAFHKGDELKVTMLDVGQGDGFCIQSESGKSYFVDGGSSDVSGVGKYRIEPFLKANGIRQLECVFISHGDRDHTSGMEELLEFQNYGIKIKKLVLPVREVWDESLVTLAGKAKACGTKVYIMKAGDRLCDGDLVLTCMAPGAGYTGEKGNAASLVLSLQFQAFDMLFTGDVEGQGEKDLEDDIEKHYESLKAAHHGSKNSGTDSFLDKVSPEIVWISAGINNRYGHPHTETLARLQERNCRIYNTQTSGAVTLFTNGEKMRMKTYLECE